jgi:hypothetical protein
MNELVIERKKYVLITRKEYELLKKRASLKTRPEKLFTVAEARAYSKELIRKWAKEK